MFQGLQHSNNPFPLQSLEDYFTKIVVVVIQFLSGFVRLTDGVDEIHPNPCAIFRSFSRPVAHFRASFVLRSIFFCVFFHLLLLGRPKTTLVSVAVTITC